MDFTAIVERIMDIANERQITGRQIGTILGLSKSPLTDWKNKKSKPTLEQIMKICEHFAISSDYILFGNQGNSDIKVIFEKHIPFDGFLELDECEQQIIIGKISEFLYNKRHQKPNEDKSDGIHLYVPFAASGWDKITPEQDSYIQGKLREFEKRAKEVNKK